MTFSLTDYATKHGDRTLMLEAGVLSDGWGVLTHFDSVEAGEMALRAAGYDHPSPRETPFWVIPSVRNGLLR